VTRRTGGPAKAVLSPSDVAGTRAKTVTVGGRVTAVFDGASFLLADALGAVRVSLNGVEPVQIGDLVAVRGLRSGGRALRNAVVISRSSGGQGRESARFTTGGVGRHLQARARALSSMRAYFDARAFIEVETPLRVPAPGLDAHVNAIPAEGGFLITSPELHMKRLLAGGVPRIYQLARVSRAEELGALHEPEFTMLEWYRAWGGVESVMHDTEALVSGVVRALRGEASVHAGGRFVDVTPPFDRVTVRQAFRAHAGIEDAAALAADDPDRYFQVFVDSVEPALAARPRALLLCEFPVTEAALARPCPHDPTVAERFEAYVAGVELCNGFGELTDPCEQRRRFEMELERRKRAGEPLYPIDEKFLAALEEGLPPCAGNALGVDRLVALAAGTREIADVTAFPARSL
jgi:lysyl-tRNA synthetase class 2